ncbi:unnamed protein product, partial [Laminaria digitata]
FIARDTLGSTPRRHNNSTPGDNNFGGQTVITGGVLSSVPYTVLLPRGCAPVGHHSGPIAIDIVTTVPYTLSRPVYTVTLPVCNLSLPVFTVLSDHGGDVYAVTGSHRAQCSVDPNPWVVYTSPAPFPKHRNP